MLNNMFDMSDEDNITKEANDSVLSGLYTGLLE